MRSFIRGLTHLLSIRPGEGKKTLLLYLLQLVFFIGLTWGDAARESLFLANWSPDDLAYMFILNAVLGFFLGLIYTFLADRINNSRMLYSLTGLILIWLISVRLLLISQGGPRGLVYPYFYVAFVALRDLSTLHLVTFINDFFDTRAAKRLLPLLLSAGIAGGILAGFTGPLLNHLIGVENVPVAWGACLLVFFALLYVTQRNLRAELTQIEQARLAARKKQNSTAHISSLENLRQGFEVVRQSGLLRWLALASFWTMIMLNLLFFQSSRIFVSHFANDREALFNFYNILGGIGNITGLLIQSLLLSRLVARFGVGSMNLVFPSFSMAATWLINLFPGFPAGIFARLDTTLGRQALRNPLDAMLYNSVPLNVKTRARGFISSLLMPLGTLTAGLFILAYRLGNLPTIVIPAIAIGAASAYWLAMFKVRGEYVRALASLLTSDEVSIFRLSSLDNEMPDPATMELLRRRMQATDNDRQALLIAEMLYGIEERLAIPALLDLARQRSPAVRIGLIQLLAADWITDHAVRKLCTESLRDEDDGVRKIAAAALLNYPDVAQEPTIIEDLSILLTDRNPSLQAAVLPIVLSHGTAVLQMAAQAILEDWLTTQRSETTYTLALQVLAAVGSSRLPGLLQVDLANPDPFYRRRAIAQITELLDSTIVSGNQELISSGLLRWACQALGERLLDSEESLRLAALQTLGNFQKIFFSRPDSISQADLKPLLIAWVTQALRDSAISVRRLACELAPLTGVNINLEAASHDTDAYLAESAVTLLMRRGHPRAHRRLLELAEAPIRTAYALHLLRQPLHSLTSPSARLLDLTLREAATAQVERLFWLLTTLHDKPQDDHPSQVDTIRRSLSSPDPLKRANAQEALDALVSPTLAVKIVPLVDGTSLNRLNEFGRAIFFAANTDLGATISIEGVIRWAWPTLPALPPSEDHSVLLPCNVQSVYPDGWLTAVAIHAAVENTSTYQDPSILRTALIETCTDPRSLVYETAQSMLERLGDSGRVAISTQVAVPWSAMKEADMLSLIEKVLFLQEVPFFKDIPLQELRILASIAEEKSVPGDEKVFSQGDATSSLYVIVSGRVAVQQRGRRTDSITRLAELGPREYFAEASVFDEQPHAADILAIEATDLLIIRRATLVALIINQPEIGLSLLKALSEKLRQAYADIAAKTHARPKQIQDLFDAFSTPDTK